MASAAEEEVAEVGGVHPVAEVDLEVAGEEAAVVVDLEDGVEETVAAVAEDSEAVVEVDLEAEAEVDMALIFCTHLKLHSAYTIIKKIQIYVLRVYYNIKFSCLILIQ